MIELYSKDDVEFLRNEISNLQSVIHTFFNTRMTNVEVHSITYNKKYTDINLHIGDNIYFCVIRDSNIDFQYYNKVGALTIYEIEDAHSTLGELYDIFLIPENKKTLLEYNSVYVSMRNNFECYCENIKEYFMQHTITSDSDANERSLKIAYAMLI